LFRKAGLFVITLGLSSFVYGNPSCSGSVSGVSISSVGKVLASVNSGTAIKLNDVVFCNINATEGDYSGEGCKGVLSLLLSASATQKSATLWFREASFTSCEQSWTDLKDSGLYHIRINR